MSSAAALDLPPLRLPEGLEPLGQKQRSDHADWLRTWEALQRSPDVARADALVAVAAQRVRDRLQHVDAAAYGWSGGKDSVALEVVMREAGVTECVLAISGLEWPAFLAWATDHMPWGLTVECNRTLDYRWLLDKHRTMLFPQGDYGAAWFRLIQHTGQRAYCASRGIEVLLGGWRGADGNNIGRRWEWEYLDKGGFVRFGPIADWSHEDTLNVIAARGMSLPPCYTWPRGFRVGTGAWPARQWTRSKEHGWNECLAIDPTVVETAAAHGIPGAAEALDRYEHRKDV